MKRRFQLLFTVAAVAGASIVSYQAGLRAQDPPIEGNTYRAGDFQLQVLYDGQARDEGVDVGVMTFAPGTNSGDHRHAQTEIFYVLEGGLEHIVNGESQLLRPGMLGSVSPPDRVNHVTSTDVGETRALVIWSPAGNARSIANRWARVD